MQLILLKDVEKVGRKGDVVRVRDGFARNFLLARNLALAATRSNRQFFEEQKIRSAKRREKERTDALGLSEKMTEAKVVIQARAGDHDKLFGSVTAEDICEALCAQGFRLDKKQIHLREPIRSLGTHTVTVDLYPQVKATITVEVIQRS